MMGGGNLALAAAIASMDNVNLDAQNTKVGEIVVNIQGAAPLSMSWSKQWQKDANQYFIDSLKVIASAMYTAIAAADYAKYQTDLQAGQEEMAQGNNLLQQNKSVLQALGNAMALIYSLLQEPLQQQKALSKEILALG